MTKRARAEQNQNGPSGNCASCGDWSDHLWLDHVVPRADGGEHSIDNLQWLCGPCETAKTIAEQSRMMKANGAAIRLRSGWRQWYDSLSDDDRLALGAARSERMKGNQNGVGGRGKPKSAEHRAKIAAANIGNRNAAGTRHSAEARERMAEARRRWWADRKSDTCS